MIEPHPELYDVVVLGAGNAGIAAASVARAAGRSVLIAESGDVGGTCALRGCVPKKVLVAAAEALDVIDRAAEHHIAVDTPRLDWARLIERERTFVEGVPEDFEASLSSRGIELVRGAARFVGPDTLRIAGRTVRAGHVVVATGSRPRPLPIPGFEHSLTSDDLLEMRELPTSIVFIGAGVIAFEFSHVLARAGVKVTLLEAAERPLLQLDTDAVAALGKATERLGIDVVNEVQVEGIERRGEGFAVRTSHAGEVHVFEADAIVNGAGRVAQLAELDLGAAGITVDRGRVDLDEFLRSRENPAVSFAGDAVAAAPQLSPVATYEGKLVGRNLLADGDDELEAPDYGHVPAVVHTVPALASVGMTEAAARDAGVDVRVTTNDMTGWRSARTFAERAAWAKVVLEQETGRILGAHLLGHGAAETVHAFAFAIRHGLTATDLAETVTAYPTFHADLKYLV